MGWIENRHLKALAAQNLMEVIRNFEKAAEIVIKQPDFHPLRQLTEKHLMHTVPKLAGAEDEIFDKNKLLRRL